MFTRRHVTRAHVPHPVPHVPGWRAGAIQGAGEVRFIPPPPVVMMDPSDKRTWRRPVRWT